MADAHHWCQPCDALFATETRLKQHHIEGCHMCEEYERYFNNENDLRMYLRTHAPVELQCYGCYPQFASFSPMLIHLEAGNCTSGTNRTQIDFLAFKCYQRRKYTPIRVAIILTSVLTVVAVQVSLGHLSARRDDSELQDDYPDAELFGQVGVFCRTACME